MSDMKDICSCVSFGLRGHSEQYQNGLLSGYSRPHNWEPRKDTDYSNCLVIDKRDALEADPALAFRSPLCSGSLADDEISKLQIDPSNVMVGAMMAVPGNGFGQLAALHMASTEEEGPLDFVSPQRFAQWWRSRGARTGRVVNGAIVWDDGAEKC